MTSDSIDTSEIKVELEDCSDTEVDTIVASILLPKRKRKPRQIWSPDGDVNSSENVQVDEHPTHQSKTVPVVPVLQEYRLKPQGTMPGRAKAVKRTAHENLCRNKSAFLQKPHGPLKNTLPTVHSHVQKVVGRGYTQSSDRLFLPITSEKGYGLQGAFRQEVPSGHLTDTSITQATNIISPKPIAAELHSLQGKVPGMARPFSNVGARDSMPGSSIELMDDTAHIPMKRHRDMPLNIEDPETLIFVTEDSGDQPNISMEVEDYSTKEILLQVVQDIKDLRELFLQERSNIAEKLDFITHQLNASELQSSPSREMEILHSLPLGSINRLNAFAAEIENNRDYRLFLPHYLKERSSNLQFKCVGGGKLSAVLNKTVNDMCSAIMTNSLARNFCMKGRTVGKFSFEENYRSIIEVIFEGVKLKARSRNIQVDIITIKQSIAEWLRQSKGRLAGSLCVYNLQ